jgi:hypothetical protein
MFDEAEQERQQQQAALGAELTGLIGAGDAAGAGGPRTGAGDQANQMLEIMRLLSQMTLSNQHAQQVMLQPQDASSAAAADLVSVSAATAANALAKQTSEMSLNPPVLFWGISARPPKGTGRGLPPTLS